MRRRAMAFHGKRTARMAFLVVAGLAALATTAACETPPFGYQVVGRDAFPVFDDPRMLSAQAAEDNGAIYPRDAVIGVAHNGEAKAYPITVMGLHELGNDTIGGVPIAISW
ncbi:MAG: DUF3179 domain-containing protein [SAR324 cluster bacterium]|nr:DUF3179 domain-containing protein [SAR324 cluster bacterium]